MMAIFAFTATTAASTVLELDLESLVANSDDIVIGTVIEVDSRVEPDGRVYSYIRIGVTEAIKGPKEEEIVIRQIGGRADDLVTYVPGMPEFVPQEQVFLFIERTPRHGLPVITGMAQGKFSIHVGPDATTRFVVPEPTELRMIRPRTLPGNLPNDRSLKDAVPEGGRLREVKPNLLYSTVHELESFKDQVRELIADQSVKERP
jgi:hypothetical protein